MAFSITKLRNSRTVRNIATFAGGNLIATVMGLAGSLVTARYVGPGDMGVFKTFALVSGYLIILHLGVFDGLLREIPIQLARGNPLAAEKAASACLSWIAGVSVGCALLFVVLAVLAAFNHNWMVFWGWLASIPGIVYVFYGTQYLQATYRTSEHFGGLTRANLVQALAGLLVLPLIPLMGYYAVCLRNAVTTGVNVSLLHIWRPMRVKPRVDWREFYQINRIGLPLSGIGYIWLGLWVTVEGSMILAWFGELALGLYAVALNIRTLGAQLAQNVNQVIGVKIYEQFGRTGIVTDTLPLVVKPVIFAFLGSIPLIVVGWLLMPFTVHLLMPKYDEAVLMMRLMLAMITITVLQLPITMLWAAARLWDCFACIGGGFLVFVACSFCLRQFNLGALGVIISSMIGQAMTVVIGYILIYRVLMREKASVTPMVIDAGQNVAK